MSYHRDIAAICSYERAEQAPDPGRSNGQPLKLVCLDCGWRGKGSIARAEHWDATRHRIVYADDPRVSVSPWLAGRETR